MANISESGSQWIPAPLIEVTIDNGQLLSASNGMTRIMSRILSIQPPTKVTLHAGTVPSLPGGGQSAISTTPNNRLTTGADGGLFVPDITIDPLAYSILSRN